MEYTIRPAEESDATAMLDLLNPIIEAGCYTAMEAPLGLDEQLDYIRLFPAHGVFLVAIRNADQRLVGMQSAETLPGASLRVFGHIGEISTFVALDIQRQAIGQRLSDALVSRAKAWGFRKLTANVRADNPKAICFYLAQGFQIIGTAHQHAFLQGRYIDEILLERQLV